MWCIYFIWSILTTLSSSYPTEEIHHNIHNRNEVPAIISNMWSSSRLEMPSLHKTMGAVTTESTNLNIEIDNSDNGKTLFFENPNNNHMTRPGTSSSTKDDAIINKMWGEEFRIS